MGRSATAMILLRVEKGATSCETYEIAVRVQSVLSQPLTHGGYVLVPVAPSTALGLLKRFPVVDKDLLAHGRRVWRSDIVRLGKIHVEILSDICSRIIPAHCA
jgi:hypothetical protein